MLTDKRFHQAVEVAERYADGQATSAELARAAKTARAVAYPLLKVPDMYAAHAVCDATVDDRTMSTCQWPWIMPPRQYAASMKKAAVKATETYLTATNPRRAALLRCIYGDPFRPATVGESCRTPPIIALAQQAYDARLLPSYELNPKIISQLAEALENAVANPEAIAHLRGTGPHARGCWVVDKLLGKPVTLTPQAKITPSAPDAEPKVEGADELAPCQLIEGEDGNYQLSFRAFESTSKTFEQLGTDGGGYGWHAVVDALVRWKLPKLAKKIDFDPEASMFVAFSPDRDALRQVASLILTAYHDEAFLREAIRRSNRKLMN